MAKVKGHDVNGTPKHPYATIVRFKWPLAILSVALSTRYLWWRATHTLNYDSTLHLSISLILLAAEIYGFLSLALFYLHVTETPAAKPAPLPPEPELPSVDVFVPIYNEPADILYRTLVGCLAMDYPKHLLKVCVLDDGPREDIRALAQRLGCVYLTRPDHSHAKAGNVNHALAHSGGDIVAIMDCDHVPVRSFLKETIGFFRDPQVALVQMPHHFYNPDTFQRNLHLEGVLTHEQDLFFNVVLPGRKNSGAVMFCGSSALLRRSALKAIGGIRTETAIEDTHTSMTLQSKGYKGIYYPRILSGALSPESFKGYLVQRQRWTRGGIQIFILDNPLLVPGLSVSQKLHYLSSTFYFFHGLARLVFMLAPLTFLLVSLNPLVADTGTLLSYFLPHYGLSHILLAVMSREYRSPFWSDVYEAASVFNLSLTALVTMLNPTKLVFNVTPKGEDETNSGRVHWSFVMPHAVLLVLLTLGLIAATRRVLQTGLYMDAFVISSVWSLYNFLLLACAIEAARERVRFRKDYRLAREIECQVVLDSCVVPGRTLDLSESGVSIRLPERWYIPQRCRVRLVSDYGETTEVPGELVRKDWPTEGGTRIGVRFTDMNDAARQGVIRQMFSPASSWDRVLRPRAAHSVRALWQIATSGFRHRFRGQVRKTRAWPRVFVRLACEVSFGGSRSHRGLLHDISATGASLVVPGLSQAAGDVTLRFDMNGAVSQVRGTLIRGEKRPDGLRCVVRFTDPAHYDISALVPKGYASVA